MLVLIFAAVFAVLIYLKFIKPLNYWKQRGILGLKPWPIFGNMAGCLLRQKTFVDVFNDVYKAFPEERYVGFYQMTVPSLMIRDLDLIKKIFVKEFDTFPQHRLMVPEDVDPLWNKNLFAMRGGEKWHDVRSTMSPTFTSGKMRMMFGLMKECTKQLSSHLLKQDATVSVEMKDIFSRFTNDLVATTAFGVTCDSLQYPENEFLKKGNELNDVTGIKGITVAISAFSPFLAKVLGLKLFKKSVRAFFGNLVKDTIKTREEQGIIRPDMLHLLMEARKGRLKQEIGVADAGFAVVQESELGKTKKRHVELTDDDIVAQSLVFFFAGFDTSSTMMSFTAYELALNLEIQEKLRREIDEALEKNNGELTYELLMGMKYLDMVITESLRKWPPFDLNDRESVRPYTIEPEKEGEKPLYLETGSVLLIPTYSIHRDPKHWPNPEKFDPERFSAENRDNINLSSYIPFGMGPRNCIGSRFALLEGKIVIAEIISKFEIFPVEKTQIPVKFSKKSFVPLPEKGIWLGIKPRVKAH